MLNKQKEGVVLVLESGAQHHRADRERFDSPLLYCRYRVSWTHTVRRGAHSPTSVWRDQDDVKYS